jgi:ABC-type lipoprotein export system ATPase subunit
MPSLGPLRRLPAARLLAAAELVVLAREHLGKLEPHERRRVVELLTRARGRPRSLSVRERHELGRLVRKVEPKAFVQAATTKLTGVPVGPKRGRRG